MVASWALIARADVVAWVAALPVVAVCGFAFLSVAVVPELRWRRWRYELREEEIDLKRGILWQRRTLVPLSRVQHVDTKSGPLQRRFGLATVEVYTAAGPEEIPELALPVAMEVRDRISELSRTAERL